MSKKPTYSFEDSNENELVDEFLANGYVIRSVESLQALDDIRNAVVEAAIGHLNLQMPDDARQFLDNIDSSVSPSELNAMRLQIFTKLKSLSWFRAAYFELARNAIFQLVGNELSMQRNVNLSIQLPDDSSSLLPVHADSLNGDSPFEVVLWVPLVDCHRTKSMYILPLRHSQERVSTLAEFADRSSEQLFDAIKDHVEFLNVPFGSCLIFSQNLLHGNRINHENTTRWSMNCRFKSLLSPYADKKFGEFFEPITVRPATTLGLGPWSPDGFYD